MTDWILEVHAESLPRLFGPFGSRQEADAWARLNIVNGSWEIAPLTYPYLRSNDD